VGLTVGARVGDTVGLAVGENVGDCVGRRHPEYTSGLVGGDDWGSRTRIFPTLHNEDGMIPPKLLRSMFKVFKLTERSPNELGILPDKEFFRISILLIAFNSPSELGIVPVNTFALRAKFSKAADKSPTEDGTDLEKLLEVRDSVIKLDRLPIVLGMDPNIQFVDSCSNSNRSKLPIELGIVPTSF
jgi:hypothetical protein